MEQGCAAKSEGLVAYVQKYVDNGLKAVTVALRQSDDAHVLCLR
jgi:hypothetical protein